MIEIEDKKLALFCSVKCPGKLILDAYDTCRRPAHYTRNRLETHSHMSIIMA